MERPGAAEVRRLTPARMSCEARKREAGSGGRSKCMSGRQSARTRRRVDESDNSWGHAANRKVHRVRNAGENCDPRPFSRSRLYPREGWTPPVCRLRKTACGSPCADAETARGCSHASAGAPGQGFPPVVPHSPYGARGKTTDDRRALWPAEHGAMTRVRSPDAAKRNPGSFGESQPPYSASLHTGYGSRRAV